MRNLLSRLLSQQLSGQSFAWLESTIAQADQNFSDRAFLTAFSTLPRHTGKHDLALTAADLQSAQALCPGWHLAQWSVDQAARSLLLLSLPQAATGALNGLLEKLYASAGIAEAVTLHQTLPLLPWGDRYQYWALEGFRSQITPVFNAIALRNSYPAHQFDDANWNQLILKAIFIGSPLHPIWGLDERANAELARMLLDYAHERWAAQRDVTPELWRLVTPFLDAGMIPDVERALRTAPSWQQPAIAFACWQAVPPASRLLAPYPDLQALVSAGQLSWQTIYEQQAVLP